jgi:hypothetical protein
MSKEENLTAPQQPNETNIPYGQAQYASFTDMPSAMKAANSVLSTNELATGKAEWGKKKPKINIAETPEMKKIIAGRDAAIAREEKAKNAQAPLSPQRTASIDQTPTQGQEQGKTPTNTQETGITAPSEDKKPSISTKAVAAAIAAVAVLTIITAIFAGPLTLAIGAAVIAGMVAGVAASKYMDKNAEKSKTIEQIGQDPNQQLEKSPKDKLNQLLKDSGIDKNFGKELIEKTGFDKLNPAGQEKFIADFKAKLESPEFKSQNGLTNNEYQKFDLDGKGVKSALRDAAASVAKDLQPGNKDIEKWAEGREEKAESRKEKLPTQNNSLGLNPDDTEKLQNMSPKVQAMLGAMSKEDRKATETLRRNASGSGITGGIEASTGNVSADSTKPKETLQEKTAKNKEASK